MARKSIASMIPDPEEQPPIPPGLTDPAPSAPAPVADAVPAPYHGRTSGELDKRERADLATCEAAIDNLRTAFWAAGKALQVIRDARLYRATHPTFEEYCEDRWQMRRAHADRLIRAWPLAERLNPIGSKELNEGQIRELIPLAARHGPDAAVTVYRAVAETEGVKVTAAVLKGAIDVLPADHFDAAEAVEQIRAYLTGQAPPQDAPAIPTAELWAAEADRVRTALRRIRRDAIRTAAAQHPEEVRKFAAELRELADEMEKDTQ